MNKNQSLLVVDDERNMRESLKTVLESRGYQVDTDHVALKRPKRLLE